MPYILVNNATSIEIDITAALKYTINKGDFDVILESTGLSTDAGTVVIVLRSHAITERYIRLDWREVSSPAGITSAVELRDLLLSWNIPSTIVSSSALPAGAATAANQTNGLQKIQIVDAAGNVIDSSIKLDGKYALDVFNSDIKDSLLNQSFIQLTANTTTIAIAASAGATQITVVSGTDFGVGDHLIIKQGNELLGNHFKVTAKPGANVITLDMPIDMALTTSAVVTEILDQMNVSGSLASPQIFKIAPPVDETWHITRLLFTMTDQTAMDDALFGGITALANGLMLRKKVGGVYSTHANFKYNGKFADSMYDITYATKAPSGFYGLRGRWTIEASGSVIRLDGANGDELQFLVQDDLTALDSLHWNAQGHKQ